MTGTLINTAGTLILAIGLNLLELVVIRMAHFLQTLVNAPAVVGLLQTSSG
jgi:uncharacterized membrane protein YqgA involved in biofilm formation